MGLSVMLFGAGLGLPLLDALLHLDRSAELAERRPLAAWPEVEGSWESWMEWPRAFERYWDDHFGFRRTLVRLNNRLRLLTRDNPWDTPVVIGRTRWLFVNAGEGLLDDARGVRPFEPSELARRWRGLVQRQDWLAEQGIPYFLVLAPDKHSVYPELLPETVRLNQGGIRTDQLLERLLGSAGFEIVDLRPVLKAGKSRGVVYPSNGSHWTDLGAYLGYAEIQRRVATVFPRVAPRPLESFEIRPQQRRGDLARMLGLENDLRSEFLWVRSRDAARSTRVESGLAPLRGRFPPQRQPFAHEIDDPGLPRAVIFRDSFTTALVPFLSEHYRRSAYYWTGFKNSVVLHEKPDLVIEIRVERQLAGRTPSP